MPDSEPKPNVDQRASGSVELSSDKSSSEPELPHERDQAVGTTGGVASEKVQQGARDLTRGVEDTSRGAEADKAYQQQKR